VSCNVTNVYTALIAVRVGRNFIAELPSRIEVTVTLNSADIRPRLSHRVITPLNRLRAKSPPNLQSVNALKQQIKKHLIMLETWGD
jgi:hypothetical protein